MKRTTLNPLTNARRTTSSGGGAGVNIIDNLESDSSVDGLSARQGKLIHTL